MSSTVIFIGPSLRLELAKQVVEAEYRPPIKRGDLAQLGPEVNRIGIIDGEFYQSLAVSPKEILPFLDRGIEVYGSSSVGALRAVELRTYGMVGIGRVFQMYKDRIIDGDDEVALTYDPDTFRPTSEPLVNIRQALELAQKDGLVNAELAEGLIKHLKKLYFPLRSYTVVAQLCPHLKEFLFDRRPNIKQEDAISLLKTLAAR
jgi:TfuA protein